MAAGEQFTTRIINESKLFLIGDEHDLGKPLTGLTVKEVYMKNDLTLFEDYDIRRVYDEKTETWYFSVVDIIRALLQQPDFQAARNYWKVLKNRLNKEGSETVTNCNRLKLPA